MRPGGSRKFNVTYYSVKWNFVLSFFSNIPRVFPWASAPPTSALFPPVTYTLVLGKMAVRFPLLQWPTLGPMVHGLVSLVLSSSCRYVGPFQNDAMNGQGVYTTSHGVEYRGEFGGNKFQGRGKLIEANGNVYEGMEMNRWDSEERNVRRGEKEWGGNADR